MTSQQHGTCVQRRQSRPRLTGGLWGLHEGRSVPLLFKDTALTLLARVAVACTLVPVATGPPGSQGAHSPCFLPPVTGRLQLQPATAPASLEPLLFSPQSSAVPSGSRQGLLVAGDWLHWEQGVDPCS